MRRNPCLLFGIVIGAAALLGACVDEDMIAIATSTNIHTEACVTLEFTASGSPPSYSESGVIVESLYPDSSAHVHMRETSLLNHSGCCSTPYRFRREDGAAFTVVSMDVLSISGSHSLISDTDAAIDLTAPGTLTFPAAGWTNIRSFQWAAGGSSLAEGSIDKLVICPADQAPPVDAGVPDAGPGSGGLLPAPVTGEMLGSPVANGYRCTVIRDYNEHINDGKGQAANEAGIDYQISAEYDPQDPLYQQLVADPLTRSIHNMPLRVVRAVGSGRVIHVRRPLGAQNQTSVSVSNPARQSGEEQAIIVDILQTNANESLLIEYVHIFPTFDFGGLDFPGIQEQIDFVNASLPNNPGLDAEGLIGFARDSNGRYGEYSDIPNTKNNLTLSGPTVNRGDELGFYAQIGKSSLDQGPHVHISMFTGPGESDRRFIQWLNNPGHEGHGGAVLDPAHYIPCN